MAEGNGYFKLHVMTKKTYRSRLNNWSISAEMHITVLVFGVRLEDTGNCWSHNRRILGMVYRTNSLAGLQNSPKEAYSESLSCTKGKYDLTWSSRCT